MIDLTQPLPTSLLCDDDWVPIKTDFRTWLQFQRDLKEGRASFCIFDGDVPASSDWVESAQEFLECKEATPHGDNGGGVRCFDFDLDGSYLIASFMAAYGIDLTTAEMHWHMFLALFRGLPDDACIRKIMGYRSWRNDKSSYEQQMRSLAKSWSLPVKEDEDARDSTRQAIEALPAINEDGLMERWGAGMVK